MNALRSILCVTIRGYARHSRAGFRFAENQNVPAKPTVAELLHPDANEFNYDPTEEHDDFSDLESDLSDIGQSYTEHMRETYRAKELLKKRIIERKYFKSTDPNFITWTERDHMKTLYERDSEEWTPERLSESFPALPETIRKILKSNRLSKSVDDVVKYDQRVIDNWKAFRNGSLALDPRLENHLKKFKDREIEIASLSTIAEKFVKKPPVFPTPKSQVFSNVVDKRIEPSPQKTKNKNLKITDGIKKGNSLPTQISKSVNSNESVTYDAFLDNEIAKFAGNTDLTLERQLLVDEYKKQRNIEALKNNDSVIPESNKSEPSTAVATVEPIITLKKVPKFDIKTSSLETGVVEWKKKEISNDGDYPQFIKIPRTKAKSGVTFKVQDRYYDTDGEFLYRVPGLKT